MMCSTCGAPGICTATIDDHVAPDGTAREIVGCTATMFVYGRPITEVADYWRTKE